MLGGGIGLPLGLLDQFASVEQTKDREAEVEESLGDVRHGVLRLLSACPQGWADFRLTSGRGDPEECCCPSSTALCSRLEFGRDLALGPLAPVDGIAGQPLRAGDHRGVALGVGLAAPAFAGIALLSLASAAQLRHKRGLLELTDGAQNLPDQDRGRRIVKKGVGAGRLRFRAGPSPFFARQPRRRGLRYFVRLSS